MENAVQIKGITKAYKDFTLGAVDADIPAGFATALIGANGAGKTTLIDILSGVTGNTSGEAVYFCICRPQNRTCTGVRPHAAGH